MFRKIGKIKSQIGGIIAMLCVMCLVCASNASAALDWLGITLDTTDVDTVMGLIVVGLATLWGFRKVIKTMNRS